jgi:hypothetical protein
VQSPGDASGLYHAKPYPLAKDFKKNQEAMNVRESRMFLDHEVLLGVLAILEDTRIVCFVVTPDFVCEPTVEECDARNFLFFEKRKKPLAPSGSF